MTDEVLPAQPDDETRMHSPDWHYRRAEELLEGADADSDGSVSQDIKIRLAEVHAILAQ